MLGKFINNYYYGKSGKGDFRMENLPKNRMQLFWEMLQIRFSAIMRINLTYALVWLPAIIVITRGLLMWYNGMMQLSEGIAEQTLTPEISALYQTTFNAIAIQSLLFLIPCIAITGPFTAGLCYVLRNWARDEHAFVWSDFIENAKLNWKQSLIVSSITGLLPFILYTANNFYVDMRAQNALYIIPQVLCVLFGICWACMSVYMYPQIVTYNLKIKDVFSNALILSIARLPQTLGLRLLSALPPAIALIVGVTTPYFYIALLVALIYYVLLGFGLSRFIYASYSNGLFDLYINSKMENVKVNQGLAKSYGEKNNSKSR